ncbi:MAG: hypothetical protein Fur002_11720 [Anaerolineales bacterium]
MPHAKTSPLVFLILGFVWILGAYARLLPAMLTHFPVTDGGLFFLMAQAVQNSHYALPAFVEYNGLTIPFAYPPLGFYFAAFLSDVFHLPLWSVFRWLPAALSIAFMLAFYPLAAAVLRSPLKGAFAAAFFALLPRSIGWFVMGGGITRAWGQLFLILTLNAAYRLFTTGERKYLAQTILFGAGAVLSHPESALHTAALSAALWLFFGRDQRGIKNALLAALGVAALIAPFFGTVLARHGMTPYQNAMNASLHNFTAWLYLFNGAFADEKFIAVISALALLGLALTLLRREFFLAIWLILPALLDPRGAASVSILAWALLAAIGFAEVVLPGLGLNAEQENSALRSPRFRFVFIGLVLYAFVGLAASGQAYLKLSVNESERAAMRWAAENLPARSRFLVVTGSSLAFSDAVSEWFPALTPHISLLTPQGAEWLNDKSFTQRLGEYDALQACLNQSADCLSAQNADYIWTKNPSPLAESLQAGGAPLVYQNDSVLIFESQP